MFNKLKTDTGLIGLYLYRYIQKNRQQKLNKLGKTDKERKPIGLST